MNGGYHLHYICIKELCNKIVDIQGNLHHVHQASQVSEGVVICRKCHLEFDWEKLVMKEFLTPKS